MWWSVLHIESVSGTIGSVLIVRYAYIIQSWLFFSNWLIFGETVKDRFLTFSPPYAPLSFLCCDPCHYSFFIISYIFLFFQLPAFILPIFFKIDNFQRKNSIYFCMIRKDITMIYFQNKRTLFLIQFFILFFHVNTPSFKNVFHVFTKSNRYLQQSLIQTVPCVRQAKLLKFLIKVFT